MNAAPPTPPLMEALKEAVQDLHARIEALPFTAALTRGQLPLEGYVGQLRAMAVLHGTFDHEVSRLGPGAVQAFLAGRPSRLPHLRRDLSRPEAARLPDLKDAQPHLHELAEWFRRRRVEQPTDLLGILYVLEGMTLGNAVHLPDVLRCFPDLTDAHYYQGYGAGTGRNWMAFRDAMNGLALDAASRERLPRVARAFFARLEALVATLHPAEGAERVFTAGMLNPEAGDHPVPQDPAVLEAAVAAAEACRAEFPYFEVRFQERGRGFARSDAAWLATLPGLPDTVVLNQVAWLGGILSNRGIPRLTLERQLELLHGRLLEARPDLARACGILLEAAARLREERFRVLPEAFFRAQVRAFQAATDGEAGGTFQGTGALLLSAFCDQECGHSEAVTSLQPWLTNPTRFPPAWLAAVSTALQAARELRGAP